MTINPKGTRVWTRDDLPSTAWLCRGLPEESESRYWTAHTLTKVLEHLNAKGGAPAEPGKSCCEEAAQSADEVDRLTRERDEWESKYWDMRDDRNAEDVKRLAAESARADLEAERDELQRRLDAAGDRPTLDEETVASVVRCYAPSISLVEKDQLIEAITNRAPAVPPWPGDVPDPDDIEVERGPHGDFYVDDDWIAYANSTVYGVRKFIAEVGESCARYEAVARFIEAEEAKRSAEDERTEEQAKALWEAVSQYGVWFNTAESARERCRAAIRAGWTKEADK